MSPHNSNAYSEVRWMIRNVQKDLSAALRMRDGFLDGGEGVGPGHGYVQPAGGDHLRRLHDCWQRQINDVCDEAA
jgi:hypothetical protein